jgi:hypothetical protein
MAGQGQRETILEFRVSGQFGFIQAIDVATGIEVSVTVPAATSKTDRETLALRRLAKALADLGYTQPSQTKNKNGGTPEGSPPIVKRGLIV